MSKPSNSALHICLNPLSLLVSNDQDMASVEGSQSSAINQPDIPPESKHSDQATFECFPIQKLPVEIQLQIWKYSTSDLEPRVIELYQRRKQKFFSPTLAPSLLHVCSASRLAALQRYRPLYFGKEFSGAHVDWEKDTVFFNDDFSHPERGLYGKLDCTDAKVLRENCQKVAIGHEALRTYASYIHTHGVRPVGAIGEFPFMHFRKLREVTAVLKCTSGEGSLSFDCEKATQLYLFCRSLDLLLWRTFGTLNSIKRSHEANERGIEIFIAHAYRGKEKRLKGRAKLSKGKK